MYFALFHKRHAYCTYCNSTVLILTSDVFNDVQSTVWHQFSQILPDIKLEIIVFQQRQNDCLDLKTWQRNIQDGVLESVLSMEIYCDLIAFIRNDTQYDFD